MVANGATSLSVIISLFFLVSVVFGAGLRRVTDQPIRNEPYKVCKSAECIRFSNLLRNSINTSVDRCDNFYDYVCSGSINKTGGEGPFSNWETWGDVVNNRRIDILKESIKSTDSVSLKKAKQIFGMCMGNLDDRGLEELKSYISRLGGWPILIYPQNDWNVEKNIQWQTLAMHFDCYELLGSFYKLDLRPQISKQARSIIISRPSTNAVEVQQGRFEAIIIYLTENHPKKDTIEFRNATQQDILDVIELAKKLKNITESEISEEKMTIKEFQKLYDDNNANVRLQVTQMNWLRVIQNAYPMHNINESEEIIVQGVDYFKEMSKLLSEIPPRTVVNYILWFFIRQMMPHTNDYTRKYNVFPADERKREKRCTLEEPNLDHVLIHEYIKKYFPNDWKVAARYDAELVRYELKHLARTSPWMDRETMNVTEQWLTNMTMQLGGPEWYSDSNIDKYYENLNISPNYSYFRNILNILQFKAIAKANLLRRPLDLKNDWFLIHPMAINAIYHGSVNAFALPIAIVGGYTYHKDRPPAVNYGLFGYLAAHEMTHGYNVASGKWSHEAIEAYNDRTGCLILQYNDYEIPEAQNSSIKLNGRLTQFENIADNGIIAAYQAYKTYMSIIRKPEERLVNFENYTPDQLFFISFATYHCQYVTGKMEDVDRLIHLSHAPGRQRVLGSLSNLDEFAAAFNCPKGKAMNPRKKCKIWE